MALFFEACVDSVASAMAAEFGGARRLELCDSLVEGGITPSIGKISQVVSRVKIPVNVLIRPRGGDFCYDEEEMQIMLHDISQCRTLGVHGVVIGVLQPDGSVDAAATRRLIDAARPMSVTFHRAIDTVRDPIEAFKTCIALQVDRVLTSGHANDALTGAVLLQQFVSIAQANARGAGQGSADGPSSSSGTAHVASQPLQRPIVIAGGGVTAANVAAIVSRTGVYEVHGTARVGVQSGMKWRQPDSDIIYMGGERRNTPEAEYTLKQSTPASVAAIIEAAEGAVQQ